MISQRGDTGNYSGTTLILVLLLLFISSFSGKPLQQTSGSIHFVLNSEFSLSHSKAVISDAVQLPSAQKSCLHIRYNENIILYCEADKLIADNRKINQQFFMRQKAELLIKPSLPDKFCFHPVPTENDDLPILG